MSPCLPAFLLFSRRALEITSSISFHLTGSWFTGKDGHKNNYHTSVMVGKQTEWQTSLGFKDVTSDITRGPKGKRALSWQMQVHVPRHRGQAAQAPWLVWLLGYKGSEKGSSLAKRLSDCGIQRAEEYTDLYHDHTISKIPTYGNSTGQVTCASLTGKLWRKDGGEAWRL